MNDYVAKKNNFLKQRENGLLLTDYQIEVLKRFNIDYLLFSDYKNLIYFIEKCLDDDYDEELDLVSSKISELYYYNYSNK